MMLVKLTHVNGRELHVNPMQVTYVLPSKTIETETYIQIGGGSEVITVKESLSEVLQLLTNSKGVENV